MAIPIQFILEIVVHLLQCPLYVDRGLDLPSFLEIILFEFPFEIIKKCTEKNQSIPLSDFEIPLYFDSLSMTDVKSGIPLVRSVTIYRLCQALELETILDPTNVINPKMIQTKPSKLKQIPPTPAIYSFTLFKICEALDINVELHPENKRPAFVNKKKRRVPMVHSPTV
ncbi:hypothetical protein TNCV_3669611 [Trichonephila clavipes]|nr:hypothetical protein TNCV_3669611 [Trichonephila clavipes]